MSAPVFVRLGLCTPLGLDALSTQCAVGAGLSAFAETEAQDPTTAPVRAARLSAIDPASPREDRMLFMARRALAECLADLDPARTTSIAGFLALPEKDARPFDDRYVVRAIHEAAGRALPIDWSARPIRAGRAGFFLALEAAAAHLAAGKARVALVGALDSGCDLPSLDHFADAYRVLCSVNPDGLIPGEGAGFVLLAQRDAAVGFEEAYGELVASASARDALPWHERKPHRAEALTAVFRQLRQANAGRTRPQHLFSCQTGESFWARELGYAYLRNSALMPEPEQRTLVASSLGDAGAASGVIQLAMAFAAFDVSWRTGHPVRRALLYGAADEGAAGASLVAAMTG